MTALYPTSSRCPKCRKRSLTISLYLHVEAPGDMFHNISRAALREREFVIRAALWETTFWSCTNCNFVFMPLKRVRLVDEIKTKKPRRKS